MNGRSDGGGLVACTIVSKNYLPLARVLAESFLRHHPNAKFFVLLVDRVDGFFDPARESFTLIAAEELKNLGDFRQFAFKYSILELNTAVKPFFLAHLLALTGCAKLVYFDPDIWILRPLHELERRLDDYTMVLTPHLTAPIADDLYPDELAILRSGAYNLGFIALSAGAETDRFLLWWQERVNEQCLYRVEQGLFVDQRWMDLAPGLFPEVFIERAPGYNVAYWNLHQREVARGADGFTANGEPLYFFHFSGFEVENPGRVSKHQNRFTLRQVGGARELFVAYRERLLAAGYAELQAWPYAFGRFDNGLPISITARSLYHELVGRRDPFGDPFAASGEGSFFNWLNAPADGRRRPPPYPSRLLHHLWSSRPDLVQAYPEPLRGDSEGFLSWAERTAAIDFGLEAAFLDCLRAPAAPRLPWRQSLKRSCRRLLRTAYVSKPAREARYLLKRALGNSGYESLRSKVRAAKRRLRGRPANSERSVAATGAVGPVRVEGRGLNIAGYIKTESGMGEGVRLLIRSAAAAGIPHSLHNLELHVQSRMADETFSAFSSDFQHDVNLFFVNADQVEHVREALGPRVFAGRHNIGLWLWELQEFPSRWQSAFRHFHEIWTPSRFCADAISAVSPVPVRRFPLPVALEDLDAHLGAPPRRAFDLPEDRFIFLFLFDLLSYFERKNPLALLRAFKQAFAPSEPVLLVLKMTNRDWNRAGYQRLEDEAAGWPVRLIDEYYSQRDVQRLLAAADSYVSLHRAEGYGLTMAEAMALEKPVIATAYSGNTDFMNASNSFGVRYRLVEIEEQVGPYEKGVPWAEPDVGHAAELMRWVYDHPAEAREVARCGRRDVADQLSLARAAVLMQRRFERIVGR